MTTLERSVAKAIEDALQEKGDADIQAGLAWLSLEDWKFIARAALAAVRVLRPGTDPETE